MSKTRITPSLQKIIAGQVKSNAGKIELADRVLDLADARTIAAAALTTTGITHISLRDCKISTAAQSIIEHCCADNADIQFDLTNTLYLDPFVIELYKYNYVNKTMDLTNRKLTFDNLLLLINAVINNRDINTLVLKNCGIDSGSAEFILFYIKNADPVSPINAIDLSDNPGIPQATIDAIQAIIKERHANQLEAAARARSEQPAITERTTIEEDIAVIGAEMKEITNNLSNSIYRAGLTAFEWARTQLGDAETAPSASNDANKPPVPGSS